MEAAAPRAAASTADLSPLTAERELSALVTMRVSEWENPAAWYDVLNPWGAE
jgi:hypothetical protein